VGGGSVGLATGLVIALFPAAAIGGGLLAATTGGGAGLGALAGHAAAGMSRKDLKELGEKLDAGQAGLIVVGVSDMGAKIESAWPRPTRSRRSSSRPTPPRSRRTPSPRAEAPECWWRPDRAGRVRSSGSRSDPGLAASAVIAHDQPARVLGMSLRPSAWMLTPSV
jgi:hypothetical protein